ncbi:MAG: transglycosylase family protein [Nitriliruptor sp.]
MLLRHARRSSAVLFAALLALTLPMTQGDASAAGFSDTDGAVYATAVDALAERGIVEGCTEDEFCPNDLLRRDQMAALLGRALETTPVEDRTFSDIDANVHAPLIEALVVDDVINGCTADQFCPRDATSRGQLASMIDRALPIPETDDRFFADADTTHGPSIERLAAAGIAAGCGDPITHFCTTTAVTRGQAALFLARALDLVPTVEPVLLSEREAEQAELDRLEAERRAEEEAARQAEAEAAAQTASNDRLRVWEDLARCESGGNWSINTGNGYYGGLQFSLSSWRWVGGSGYPHHASKTEQIKRAEILLDRQGWGAWPACSTKLGYR